MNLTAYALLIVAIMFGVAGQLLLKRGMSSRPDFRLTDLFSLISDPFIIGGFLCYGISVVIYLTALKSLDLSLAYPTVSLGYVAVILLSKVFFKENISLARWAAVIIICLGVALVGLGAG